MKNRILLDNYYLPGQLEQSIEELVRYYNNSRYHESLDNLTPSLRLCALDRKKLAAFSALGGGFLRLISRRSRGHQFSHPGQSSATWPSVKYRFEGE